jgi:hypothetical protein
MAADGKIGPSIGEILKAGLVELQNVVIPPPSVPGPKAPEIDMEK